MRRWCHHPNGGDGLLLLGGRGLPRLGGGALLGQQGQGQGHQGGHQGGGGLHGHQGGHQRQFDRVRRFSSVHQSEGNGSPGGASLPAPAGQEPPGVIASVRRVA
ncbi:MAG: hypothetical protein ACK55I_30115 [bacterium]